MSKKTFVSRLDGTILNEKEYLKSINKTKKDAIYDGLAVAAKMVALNNEFDVNHKVRMLKAGWKKSDRLLKKLIIGCEGSLDVAEKILDIMDAHNKKTLADAWDFYCEYKEFDYQNPFRK